MHVLLAWSAVVRSMHVAMILYVGILNVWCHVCKRKNRFRSCYVDSGVTGEGRVGMPKFHSWGKYTMPLTNVSSDWMSNASSGLCINLYYLHGSFKCILGSLYNFSCTKWKMNGVCELSNLPKKNRRVQIKKQFVRSGWKRNWSTTFYRYLVHNS